MATNCTKPLFSGVLLAFSMAAMAADINVTTLTDEDVANADCSLREAIVAANNDAANKGCTAGSGPDTILFLVSGFIPLTASLPSITDSLSIIGPGVSNLTIDGNGLFSMFVFNFEPENEDDNYLVKDLSLINGAGAAGSPPAAQLLDGVNVVFEDLVVSGMTRTAADGGGAIGGQNGATLTIRRTTFFNNSTLDGSGGAISASGVIVIVEDSLFALNNANGATATGGAIAVGNGGSLTVRRSTFSNNTSSDDGGAISMVAANATITIESSTFKGNSAATTGGAFMLNAGTATIRNTVIAENFIVPPPGVGLPTSNISQTGSATLTSLGHNLIGDNEGAPTAFPAGNPNLNDDYVGTAAAPIDPGLNILAENGGPTRTHQVQSVSPLIDQGSCPGELHDQRLFVNQLGGRIVDNLAVTNADDGCDIGAFERGAQILELIFLDGFETPDP